MWFLIKKKSRDNRPSSKTLFLIKTNKIKQNINWSNLNKTKTRDNSTIIHMNVLIKNNFFFVYYPLFLILPEDGRQLNVIMVFLTHLVRRNALFYLLWCLSVYIVEFKFDNYKNDTMGNFLTVQLKRNMLTSFVAFPRQGLLVFFLDKFRDYFFEKLNKIKTSSFY